MIYLKNQIKTALDLLAYYSAIPGIKSELAERYLYAIGYQESRFKYRRQLNGGPARGFWQFEKSGVKAVISYMSKKSPNILIDLCNELRIDFDTLSIHNAIEGNDVLAAAFARLLLYSYPRELPPLEDLTRSFKAYLAVWRPGKPRPDIWEKSVKFANGGEQE